MAMNLIWIKIFYDFRNVIFSKKDRTKTVICSFKRISRKLASIVNYSELFSKEIVKDFSFLFEICIVIIIIINWWNTRYLLLFKNVFNINPYAFELVAGSINLFDIPRIKLFT